jgi:hypothetical protein
MYSYSARNPNVRAGARCAAYVSGVRTSEIDCRPTAGCGKSIE